MPFYIASETLSQRMGWVEGALYSSNSVVKKILSEI
jgi:monoamine oxidase